VGCPMRCTFCATGKGGFARNLLPHEIVDQVLTVQEQFKTRVSNVGESSAEQNQFLVVLQAILLQL
jgi:adenine C2-methylase RlmN of 23S rRNA A2503 and tRNA A37